MTRTAEIHTKLCRIPRLSAEPQPRNKLARGLLMFGRILLFCLCPALLGASGCARTDDGTVVIPRPLDVRRIWDKAPQYSQVDDAQMETAVFPVAPQEPRRTSARKKVPPKRQQTPIAKPTTLSSEPAALICRDVSEPGKRFRVVCE